MFEVVYEGNLRTKSIHSDNGAIILTDAPKDNQGKGELFSPTDLVAVAAASCALTLMGIEANKLSIDLGKVRAEVSKKMISTPLRKIGSIKMVFHMPNDFDEGIREKLIKAAETCPVHASLHSDTKILMTFNWGL